MRRLLMVGVAVAALAAGLMVWLVTRSDEPSGFASPQAAVRSTCHGQASLPPRAVPNDHLGPKMHAAHVRALASHGTFKVVWVNAGPAIRFADVHRTTAGRYRVVNCFSRL